MQRLADKIQALRDETIHRGDNTKITPIFVFEADWYDNIETFQELHLTTAPTIIMVPPANTNKSYSLSRLLKSIGWKTDTHGSQEDRYDTL